MTDVQALEFLDTEHAPVVLASLIGAIEELLAQIESLNKRVTSLQYLVNKGLPNSNDFGYTVRQAVSSTPYKAAQATYTVDRTM